MATFVLFERGSAANAPALGLVIADRLPDAEAMGAAMYSRDVIAYHASQVPTVAARLAALDGYVDALERGAIHRFEAARRRSGR